jgi:hypothetical protein
VRFIRERGTRDAEPNERGNAVIRLFTPDERYLVDFAPDFAAEGWQQFDTSQDAAYFGVWVNRSKRLTLTYAEGDWVLVECPDDPCYFAEIRDAIRFYGEGCIAVCVRDDGHITRYRQDREAMFLA